MKAFKLPHLTEDQHNELDDLYRRTRDLWLRKQPPKSNWWQMRLPL
jgi:hypothetical protein